GIKNAYRNGIQGVPALLQIEKSNIWWHVSKTQLHQDETRLKISADKIPHDAKKITVKVDSKLLKNRAAYNLGGYIPGNKQADSMVIFVAHYDHLGQMGKKALFPGASDNASGTAAVL
ncbi:M28 family peptidase, partial [Arthrospira platensis SPKY1]|nr:M28 family peptidase [Arthrospira platensis SPKY1]